MKKIIVSAIAIFAFGSLNAQSAKFGVKASFSPATVMSTDVDDESTFKIGYNVGGFAEVKLTDKFAVQPEVLYSAQGTSMDTGSDDVTANFNLSYVNIPLMVKYFATEKLSLEVGPQIGFLTSAEMVLKADGEEESMDVKEDLETVDFGVNAGLGYDITKNIMAGMRYNYGVSNIAKESGDDKVNNSVWNVSVGYKF